VPYIKCLVRGKDIKLTPEEAVRQLYLKVLTSRYQYPVNRILVEYEVSFGREKKRADVAIMDKDRPNVPYIIVELKKPKLTDGKAQLRSYCNATGSPIGVWTNGDQISFYQRKDPNYFEDITDIPNVNQTLADILNERFTLVDLIKKDKLVTEKKSLKALIKEMEDEVLANAGVDVFEELFMLIFTKLYDEWESGRDEKRKKTRLLEFRNTGQTETELKTKIQGLFDRAKKKWEGVFKESDKITLSLAHLSVCVASLENVKLFNSNLDVVDEAFEYLISKSSKGEKGQYFTPRYVIDMCVKMLNPQEDEAIIDTAAGSSGFPVHTIFHVWQQIIDDEGLQVSNLFSLEKKPVRCEDYVKNRVFAIDFDEKAVRVSRTLNLIAGDGQTNVLHLNTLDYESWKERAKEEDWRDVYGDGFKRLRGLADKKDDFKSFQFDIVMANPPFAGEIKESQTISKYDLAIKPNGKRQEKMGRDILFIERNLDFLKAGGRMAVVLPQGRFNNSSDKEIRNFIAERCRILAVVGLHGNTFKPHTGTKTSVLFVQKWNDDPKPDEAFCPRQDDYNIFFATMRKSGKDNSGEKIYVKKSDGSGEFLLDDHGHLIVDHDLFNHDGLTEDGIAEAFIEFAKKENLSFFDLSSSVTPFDAEKYDRLMDELEAVELSLSDVKDDNDLLRLDSEYFKKEYIDKLTRLKKKSFKRIEDFAFVTDGIHESIDFDEESNINLISAKSPKENTFDLSKNDFISFEQHKNNPRTELKIGDVIISTVGTIGNCAVVDETIIPANSDRHVGIVRIEKYVKPYFLSTFLLSKYGKFQTIRESTGNVQLNLFIYKIKSLKVPSLSDEFQDIIQNTVLFAHQLLNNSKNIYQEAEDLLLSELGLNDWQPTDENIAVKSFSASFGTSDRLDAEYYQPKYDDLDNAITRYGFIQLVLISRNISTGFTYDSSEFLTEGIDLIRINNITPYGLDLSNTAKISVNSSRLRDKINYGDILISMSGTIGLSCFIRDEVNAFINQRIMKLEPIDFNGDTLALIINSNIGKMQLQRVGTGGVQTNLSNSDILNIKIPKLSLDIQNQISARINQSLNLKEKSKQLLETAKTGVEKAIEENEKVAINWINEQLESIQP
jgi:type I restriction enzyme M protein